MLLHEPFQLGDQIIVEGFEGTVEEISMRSTQIMTYQGERVIVPNAIALTNSVRVLTAMPHRRTDLPLILDYDTEPSLAIETLVKAISELEGVLSQPTPEVDISGINDGCLHLNCPLLDIAGTSTSATDKNQGCGGDESRVRSIGHENSSTRTGEFVRLALLQQLCVKFS